MKKLIIVLSLLVMVISGWWANRNFSYPYPAPTNIITEKTKPIDFLGLLFGTRRIIADIMWVQVLQYYGGIGWDDRVSEEEYRKYERDERRKVDYGRYGYFMAMCQRCIKIDPYFKYVYMFGGASLAWNLTRYDEALELLSIGMKHNPRFYPFHLYAAAIVYSKEGKATDVIKKLAEAIKYPDCPFEVRLILGNIYTKNGKYEDAANIWIDIYLTTKLEDRKEGAKRKLIKLISEKKLSENFLEKIK